jgi:hypothetical protein
MGTFNEPLVQQDQPFASSDDDLAGQRAAEMNDPDRRDLPEPDPITDWSAAPLPPMDEDPLDRAPVTGTPTSPPLWGAAATHPNISQLRVYRVVNGMRHSMGPIDARATEDDLIDRWLDTMPRPGDAPAEFLVRPVDQMGREVREEQPIPPIDADHHTIRRLRAKRASLNQPGAPVAPSPGAGLADMLNAVKALNSPMERMLAESMKEQRIAREEAAKAREATALERIELASRAASSTEAIAERMMNSESERTKAHSEQQSSFFSNLLAQQQMAAERERTAQLARERELSELRRIEREEAAQKLQAEREEAKDRRERDRMELEAKLERERNELSAKLAREERDFKEREAERDRRAANERDDRIRRDEASEKERQRVHERQLKEMEDARTRDREHSERMMALSQSRDKNDSAEGFIEKGTKMLAMFGVQPSDLVEKLTGGSALEPAIEGGIELLKTGISALTDYAKTSKQSETAEKMAKINADAQIASAQQPAGALAIPAGSAPAQIPQNPTGAAGAAGDLVNVPPVPGGAAPAPAKPQIVSKAPLGVQKAARAAIRALVSKLRNNAPERWEELIIQASVEDTAIYHYMKDVSVRAALKEAEAEDDLINRFLTNPAVQNVFNGVPLG